MIYVPDNYATIQDAINASANGDEIIVRPGTYVENIDFLGKAILVTSDAGPSDTIIDGNRLGPVVTFENGEGPDSIIEGFTLTRGAVLAGIYCSTASPTIRNNIVTLNNQHGIYCYQGSPTIDMNTVSRNAGDWDGGAGIFCAFGDPVITNNKIYQNKCYNHPGHSGMGGCGIFVEDCPSVIIDGNIVAYNEGKGKGGGIRNSDESRAVITNNLIVANCSTYGGGLAFRYGGGFILNNIIAYNEGEKQGGGIHARMAYGRIADNLITKNVATSGEGGGIYFWLSSTSVTIRGNTISENKAGTKGGGIFGSEVYSTISENIVFNNSTGARGGGFYFKNSKLYTVNNTIFGNEASAANSLGGGAYLESSTVLLANSIFWNNSSTFGPEAFVDAESELGVKHCDVEGGLASIEAETGAGTSWDNNIDADPMMADPANGDFHLLWDSPCKDAGDETSPGMATNDFEGDPRIAGSAVDIGADEFHPHLYCTGDVIAGQTVTFHVVGEPGEQVKIALGAEVIDPPYSTPHGDLYIWPIVKAWPIGPIPADGIRRLPVTVPMGWTTGEEYPVQGQVGYWGNPNTILTNLEILTVK